ncbi:MAG: DUF2169 family type VI secretion system accessory protein [Paracoccaceae bacterium]
MWQVTNHTPFATQGYFLRDQNGVEHWVAALRATFDLASGHFPRVASLQDPVKLIPETDPDMPDLMREESDLQPFRPATDIVLHGAASLPEAAPALTIPVTLNIGSLSKTLICSGPRRLSRGMTKNILSDPVPISSLPLTWNHSLGGQCQKQIEAKHEANPIGMGWLSDWALLKRGEEMDLPQITAPHAPVIPDQPFPMPQGFGPMQPHWAPRLRLAGTFDQAWEERRHPRLPIDFDSHFHQSVLPDQIANLVGGEPVSVINASPQGPLHFRLPQLIIAAKTRIGPDRTDTRMRLVAITIDTMKNKLSMVWNSAVPCNGRDMDVSSTSLRVMQMTGVRS